MSDPAPVRRSPAELVALHLDREIALHRRLLAIVDAKRTALVANDTAGLREQSDREGSAVSELQALRPVRERLVCGLAQHLGVTGKPSLSAVIAKLGDQAASLEARRCELADLARTLQERSETNQELLRSGLRVVEGLMGILVGSQPAAGGYDRRGMASRGPATGLIDLSG